MTNEEFLKRLDDVNKNIRPLEEYQGYHTKIKFQCLLDGNVWKNSPASIFQMHGCPKCAGKLSDEEIKERVESFEYLEFISRKGNSVTCKCKICGYQFSKRSAYFLEHHEKCPCCSNSIVVPRVNSIMVTHPEIYNMLKDKEFGKTVTYGSTKRTDFICPRCGNVINTTILNVYENGLSCKACSDGISFPNKFIYNILKINSIKFKTEKTFEWSKNKRYDFYIPSTNIIIEVNGLQHYERAYSKTGRTLEEEIENDTIKKELALLNGIKESNYIVIDARYSEIDWIVNSIRKTELMNIIKLDDDIIKSANEMAMKSVCFDVADMYNNKMKIMDISEETGLERTTIRSYLKKMAKLDKCVYPPKKEIKRKPKKEKLQIICLENEKIYESFGAIMLDFQSLKSKGNICSCCKGIRNYVYDKESGRKLHFMYYEDYLEKNNR